MNMLNTYQMALDSPQFKCFHISQVVMYQMGYNVALHPLWKKIARLITIFLYHQCAKWSMPGPISMFVTQLKSLSTFSVVPSCMNLDSTIT